MDWTEKIKFKGFYCGIPGEVSREIRGRQINLYVVTTRKCNVHCEFCEFTSGISDINIEIFKQRLKELNRACDIGTVHFTGGEPSLELDKLEAMCNIIKQTDSFITTSVNSNGTNLKELLNIKNLNNISLSRHHYNEDKNLEIMGLNRDSKIKPVSNDELKRIEQKEKIHLSCNLVKGYIDNEEEIHKYLEFASEMGINDVGIVSLMNINEFCSKHFVDVNNINLELIKNIIKSRELVNIDGNTDKICCRCENYLYKSSDLRIISLYHRYAIHSDKIVDYLVYENNNIKQGFSGSILI